MNNIIKKYIGKSSLMMAFALMATGTANFIPRTWNFNASDA